MATKKQAIKKMLNNLSKDEFKSFCSELLDRDDGPSRCQVEDKSRLEITDLLVQFYTTDRAPGVAAEILRVIGCNDEAKLLGKYLTALWFDWKREQLGLFGYSAAEH